MLFGKKKRRIQNILVVEDEPLVAFDTEHFLTEHGFSISATLDTVAEACAQIERDDKIDLVLADVALSDGSGIEVAKCASARKMLVLFVTAQCPVAAQALAAGCLSKPFNQRDLIAAIDAVEAVAEGRKTKKLPSNLSLFSDG